MKKFSRILSATALALAMSMVLAACGASEKKTEPAKTEEKAAATTAATTAAAADASWDTIKKNGKLVMGVDDNFPPMGFRDEKNNIVGYDIDLATEVCSRLGIKLEIMPIDWKMKENELDSKNIDCIWNGYSFTEERAKKVNLTKPYLENEQVLVVMTKSGFKSQADLKDKTLAIQELSSAQEALDAAKDFKASLKAVVPFKDNVTAFLDLESGNSDVLLLDKVVGEYYISQKNKDDYTILPDALAPETYVIGFRKADDSLKNKVEEALSAMVKDGKMAEITTKWFGSNTSIYDKTPA